jgi:flagellin
MSEAVQTVKAADAGIQSINTLIAAARSLATSALSADSTTATTLMNQFNTVRTQIDEMASDSGYKGVNLLGGTSVALTVKFDETGASKLRIGGFDGSTTGLSISLASGWVSGTTVTASTVEGAITALDTAKDTLRTESTKLANNLSIITARQEFTQGMINVLKDGAAGLTNADMNEEGANMLMLQTRQALGTTSLSLASQAAQSVLRLF